MTKNTTKNMRIRYKHKRKSPPNILESNNSYISSTNHASYKIRLDTDECTFKVINTSSRKIIKSGGYQGMDINWLKELAKRALKSLGVNFNTELRDIDENVSKRRSEDAVRSCKEKRADGKYGERRKRGAALSK